MTNSLHLRVVNRGPGAGSCADALSLTQYLNTVMGAGTANQVLTSQGSDNLVVWAAPSGSFAGPIGVNGATPPAQAAFPGTAAGTDAAILQAVITILVNLGFCASG